MKISWQNDADHLVGRWAEDEDKAQYRPPWMQDDPAELPWPPARRPECTAASPFGHSEWRRERPATKV